MARIDARWDNFWHRGQAWYGFDMDGPSGPATVEGSFPADAVLLRTQSGSFAVAAFVQPFFTLDAIVGEAQSGSTTLDAVVARTLEGSLAADAVVARSQTGSFALAAFIQPYFKLDAEIAGSGGVSFSLDAYIQYGFVDDKDDTPFIPVSAAHALTVVTDFSSFTADASDPDTVRDMSGNGNGSYAGWIGLDVAGDVTLRIHTTESGMGDTILAIWGPSPTPPGPTDDPFHLGDDNVIGIGAMGTKSSLHQSGTDPLGTLFAGGDAYSDDTLFSGISLTAGKWWICVWPYDDDDWDTSEGVVRLSLGPPAITNDFTVDAWKIDVREVSNGADYTFEGGISGWTEENWSGYSGTADIAWAEEEGHLAWGSMSVTFTSAGDQATLGQISGRLLAGVTYTLTFWSRSDTGSSMSYQWGLGSRTVGAQRQQSSEQQPTVPWSESSIDFTPTADVRDPVIWIASWGSTSQTIFIDEVTVKPHRTIDAVIKNAPGSGKFFVNARIAPPAAPGTGDFTVSAWKLIRREVIDLATYTFGSDIAGWTAAAWAGYSNIATISWDGSEGRTQTTTSALGDIQPSGPGVLKATFSGGSDESLLGAVNGRLIAGRSYRLAFWVRRITPFTGSIQYGFGSMSSGAPLRISSAEVSITNTRVRKTLDFTPTVDITDPVIWFASWGTEVGDYAIDDVRLVPFSGPVLDARIAVLSSGSATFTLAAVLGAPPEEAFFLLRAVVVTSPFTASVKLDAVLAAAQPSVSASLTVDAILMQTYPYYFPQEFTLDAVKSDGRILRLDAVIVATTRTATFSISAWKGHATVSSGFPASSWIDSYWGEQFTLDAVVTGLEKSASFTVAAATSAVGERRGQFTLDALRKSGDYEAFILYAEIVQARPFTISAYIQPASSFSLDAALVYIAGAATFSVDAIRKATTASTAPLYALIASAGGDTRIKTIDAVLKAPRAFQAYLLAQLVGSRAFSFTVNAYIPARFRLDAFIQPSFSVGAYIAGTSVVVYPPSQEGSDGTITTIGGSDGVALDGVTFFAPSGSFTPSMVGAIITIGGIDYIIASVIDGQTITVTGPALSGSGLVWSIVVLVSPTGEFDDSMVGQVITIEDIDYVITGVIDGQTVVVGPLTPSVTPPPPGTGLDWHIPSGSATDPLGDPPPISRRARIEIEWTRPYQNAWAEITGDVIWNTARFTQSARSGPGTFAFSLLGAFDEFVGGEEIRVSVDGFRVFGGFVTEVEYGYVFEDDYTDPVTTLSGTDYNAILDRQLVYNAEWDEQQGGQGGYKPWRSFAVETMDREIITTIARRFMSDPAADGFDFTTYVDEVDTPAPVKRWAMEPGTTLRRVLSEITRITEGVYWISPYKDLNYHDRSTITAPFPITDGDAGISCRGLTMSGSLSVTTNDVFVWGTEAFMDTGDSDIIYSRQTADSDWDEEYWSDRISRTDDQIDRITDTPAGQRTVKQRTELASLRRSRVVYSDNLATAQGDTSVGSVERLGRWQHGEFRQDIYHQRYVDRRARAIMKRYSEPVIKAVATVFDPGFQAGQVVQVSSIKHGMADDLVIREMTMDFAVVKEPDGEEFIAVPRYKLTMGLDPEEPWDIYEYLPFPDTDYDPDTRYNPRVGGTDVDPAPDLGIRYLDTFTRTYESDLDFGLSTSERDEIRPWED